MGCSSQPVKPKPAIWDKDKWNASVEAEIAKQQANQPKASSEMHLRQLTECS